MVREEAKKGEKQRELEVGGEGRGKRRRKKREKRGKRSGRDRGERGTGQREDRG